MPKSNASQSAPSVEAALDQKPLDAIGRALRAHYDDLLQEPLPRRFLDLLERLDAAEEASRKKAPRDGSRSGRSR